MTALTDEENEKLCQYLTWHALADELVCNSIATGLRHAPDRAARAALLRQMREEYSHLTFMSRLVEEHGGSLPESLPALDEVFTKVVPFVDGDWLSFLVGFQVTMDGIYGYPWSRAVMTATIRDERYFKFYDAVLFPQEIGHFNFAMDQLRAMIDKDPETTNRIVAVAKAAFPTYLEFIETSFPYLELVGCDTSQVIDRIVQIYNTFWPKEFGVALDERTATPDSGVEYGPGM